MRLSSILDSAAPSLRDASFLGGERGEILDELIRLTAIPGRLAILSGPPGVGKTMLLRCAAERLSRTERPLLVTSPHELSETWRLINRTKRERASSDIRAPGDH